MKSSNNLDVEPHVASVGVKNGTKILMAKRNDTGKWTLPGGHLEEGETPKEGAKRELYEEAGLKHEKFKHLESKRMKGNDGVNRVIHAFVIDHDGQKPTSKNDPDNEVEKWEWIETKAGLPKNIKDNLHSSKNLVLMKLGLLKSLVKGLYMNQIEFFVTDLKKSAAQSHKYLRKYQRGGKWIYVYHEPGQHARQIPEEAMKRLKELADMGDKDAKKLYESLEEYSPVKLQLLRELADSGDAKAKRHLRENHGIDREAEKLEEAVIPARVQNDSTTNALNAEQKTKLKRALADASSTLRGLSSHTSSAFYTSLSSVGGHSGILSKLQEVESASSIKDALQKMQKIAHDLDRVQPEPSTSANDTIREHNGYGSHLYNGFVRQLEEKGLLPQGYGDVHKRERGQNKIDVPLAGALEAKLRKRREREERIAQERLGRQAENVSAMKNYFSELRNISAQDQVRLADGIERFFGKDFNFNNFIANLQGHPEITIKPSDGFARALMDGSNNMSISFSFTNREGRQITSASRSVAKRSDGSIHWSNGCFSRASNDDLERYPGMAKGLYAGVEKSLREITANYTGDAKKNTKITIGTAANSGFGDGYKGALVWAKHCFDWEGEDHSSSWKSTWNSHVDSYCRRAGFSSEIANEIKSKVNSCKYPEDFVRLGVKVNEGQAKTMLNRSSFDNDFNKIFSTKGYVDLGELIMIDSRTSWSAENRIWGTDERAVELNKRRAVQYGWTNERRSDVNSMDLRTIQPTPRASTTTARGLDVTNEHHRMAQHFMNRWRPSRRNRSIAVTKARLARMRSWPRERVEAFLRFAPLSPSGRNRIRDLIRRGIV